MIKGIDVSHWNGSNVIKNMTAAQKFVIIKATEGKTVTDKMYKQYADEALKTKKLIGFYHFAHPENNSAADEANNFCKAVLPYTRNRECLLALDWEAKALKCSPAWAIEWLTIVYERTGVKPLLYVSESELTRMAPVAEHDFGLWVAKWVKSTTVGRIPNIRPRTGAWKFWAIWQYSDGNGKLDYNVFNGNKTQFKKYQGR